MVQEFHYFLHKLVTGISIQHIICHKRGKIIALWEEYTQSVIIIVIERASIICTYYLGIVCNTSIVCIIIVVKVKCGALKCGWPEYCDHMSHVPTPKPF